MSDTPLTIEEIQEQIDRVAIEADTVVCIEVALGSAVLPNPDGTFGPEDVQLCLYTTLYDPVTERIVRLPILFDFGLALDFGLGPKDEVESIRDEATAAVTAILEQKESN